MDPGSSNHDNIKQAGHDSSHTQLRIFKQKQF